nr:sigma-70 region 4 domain-containing protein [Endozoicomonas sp. YOMI1]
MDCLNHKITTLPEKQRLVFGLKDLSQMSLDDISGFIGESAANVRVLLHRARATLYSGIEQFFFVKGITVKCYLWVKTFP